jgi:hypothetical protein
MLQPELERRCHDRHRPTSACDLFVAGSRHDGQVVDVSEGGLFVLSEAPAWPGALVRIRLPDGERFAVVVRERQIPLRLRGLLPRGFGLRWLSVRPA